MESSTPRPSDAMRWFGVSFAFAFPTVLTAAYFILLAGSDWQRIVFGAGKVLQFGFPAVWAFFVLKEKLQWPRWNPRGVGLGVAFGGTILLLMMILYHFVFVPAGVFDQANEKILTKVQEIGVASTWKFVALGAFYALSHSLMEEYYWRWFVFRQLKEMMSAPWAIGISSVGFMSHHVILLATFFGWDHWATYFFSVSVAVGGAVWAWLYARSESIYGPWFSHLLIDAAIFIIGYQIVSHTFAS